MDVLYWIYFSLFIVVGVGATLVPAIRLVTQGSIAEAVWGIAWTVAGLLFFFIVMAAGWLPGEEGVRAYCAANPDVALGLMDVLTSREALCPGDTLRYIYCEEFLVSRMMQPHNTVSSLTFMAAGFWILFDIARDESKVKNSRRKNPMFGRTGASWAYAAIVIFMGTGPMLLHASMRPIEGFLDALSVILWASFGGSYTLWRILSTINKSDVGLQRALQGLHWFLWGAFIIVFIAVGANDNDSIFIFQVIAGAWFGLAEVIFIFWCRRPWRPTLMALLTIMVAFYYWSFNGAIGDFSGCELGCADTGHALFHTLAAIATFTVFTAMRNEDDDPVWSV